MRSEGVEIIYGDAVNKEILDKADVERASVVVLALPKDHDVNLISKTVRALNPKVKILARSHNSKNSEKLKDIGVNQTIEPEFEAALSLVHSVMQIKGEKDRKVLYWLRNIKELNDLHEGEEV
ncbi:MAG TPA: hypothetical protein ENI23_09975 [bacterium]|nr:hypothetical protein [bacterium]